ncbi:MAG TPA: EpsI family protein [Bryobacteraceae bacterium]|nr:EpsI family protein [Bryobacteraceae bacterium]
MPAEGGFLRSRTARILTGVLAVQALISYGFSRSESIPAKRPLAELPKQVADWDMVEEYPVEEAVQEVLKADETLSRSYRADGRLPVHLWIAYFKTQRAGQAPHSPKNCLPGNGWVPSINQVMHIPIAGRAPIEVNRYVISRGDAKSVVLYWYQSRDRAIASEYKAKFYVVADAVRYNRSDTALIRVMVPVLDNNEDAATQTGTDFIQKFFSPVRQHLPA